MKGLNGCTSPIQSRPKVLLDFFKLTIDSVIPPNGIGWLGYNHRLLGHVCGKRLLGSLLTSFCCLVNLFAN